MKYTFSRTIVTDIQFPVMPRETPVFTKETFTAVEAFSFDEAIAAVEKGIRDRKIQMAEELKKLYSKKDEAQRANEMIDGPAQPAPVSPPVSTGTNRSKNINK